MKATPILFFSDAHFGSHGADQEKRKIRRFVTLLHQATAEGAEVFFLGDLFDFWFEYNHWIPKTAIEILAAIHGFTAAGGTFHLILGNHDFWVDDYFKRELGITVHRDDLTVVRQGLRIFVSHGDGTAPAESGYRLLRRVLRFRPNVLLYRLLPADWAYVLARFFSGRSRDLSARRITDDFRQYDRVARDILATGCDAVIMGHLHCGWVKRLNGGWWINSGEFFERFTYVRLTDGNFELAAWDPDAKPSPERAG